jgi:tRNA-dihydrouridine synthase
MRTNEMIQRDIDALKAAFPGPAAVELKIRRLTSMADLQTEVDRALAQPGVSILSVDPVTDA